MKRFIVCGGSDYTDWLAVFHALNRLDERFAVYTGEGDARQRRPGVAAIIQAGDVGADAMAREWAEVYGRECITFADGAPHERNARMLRQAQADGVVAFPHAGSTPAFDMVARARHARLMVWEPEKERA